MKENTIKHFRGKHNFLSNFWLCPVWHDGLVYPSAEHAFQASKTKSGKARALISNCLTPREAKKMGRRVNLRSDWEAVKRHEMFVILESKFTNNPRLKDKLLGTKEAKLEEGNTWGDTFWGVVDGKGDNHLGKLLMMVRQKLKEEEGHYE